MRVVSAVLVSLACVMWPGAGPLGAQMPSCRNADSTSARLVHYVRVLLTSSDADSRALRDSAAISAISDSTKVVLLTDARTCDKVRDGVNVAFGSPGLGRSLYVVKTPSAYFAQDPERPSGEWVPLILLTKQFKVVTTLNAF